MAAIEVKIGELAVATGGEELTASALGSCVVIALYDPTRKIGALAHTVLPNAPHPAPPHVIPGMEGSQRARYVELAIVETLRRLAAVGVRKEDLQAKLIGGANMFAHDFPMDIGQANVVRAREVLQKEGIPVVGEVVGGSIGRSMEFSVASGIVTVKMKL